MYSTNKVITEQLDKQRNAIREDAEILEPSGDFCFKSLRGDNKCYYYRFIEELVDPSKRYDKRLGEKQNYTVRGDGIFTRKEELVGKYPLKPRQYSPEQKAKYTKFQSTSLGIRGFYSPVFTPGKLHDLLVGMMFNINHVLLTNRLYIYDNGTVGRKYDHATEKNAEKHYSIKKGSILFAAHELEKFKEVIQSKANTGKYNEALVRLSFNCDESIPRRDRDKVFIGSDTLESRLLAKQYADTLELQLKQAGKCNTEYKIPVCFYTDDKALRFKEYTEQEYQLDTEIARIIYNNPQLKEEKYNNKQWQFLLALSPDEINAELAHSYEGIPFAISLIQKKYIHIVKFLCERSGFDLQAAFMKCLAGTKNKLAFVQILLARAIRAQDSTLVHNLLDWVNDPDLICQMNSASSPLFAAVEKNMLSCVERFLECGLDVNIEHHTEGTALSLAAEKGNAEIVKVLLAHPMINVNKSTPGTFSPLYLAIKYGHVALTETLLKHPWIECKNDPYFCTAVTNGNPEMVKTLLKFARPRGLDVTKTNAAGYTPLFIASSNGSAEIVRLLLADPEISYQDSEIRAAYVEAARNGHMEIFKILLAERKIAFDEQDINDAFIKAVRIGHIEIIRILLAERKITYKEEDIRDALIEAINNRHVNVVQFLLAKEGIDFGSTSISLLFAAAAKKGYTNILNILIQSKNMDINEQMQRSNNSYKDTPFSLAAQHGHMEIANALLADPRIDINRTLFDAAEWGLVETVDKLLQLPDIHKKIQTGNTECTALEIATKKGHTEIVKRLLADKQLVHSNREISSLIISASKEGEIEIVKAFLAYNQQDLDSDSLALAFLFAAVNQHTHVLNVLLQSKNMDINKIIIHHNYNPPRTPFYWAAKFGHTEIVNALLENAKIDVNKTLLYAIELGLVETVGKLLQRPDIKINQLVDSRGNSSLKLACEFGHAEIVKILLTDSKITFTDVEINEAFVEAVTNSRSQKISMETVKILLAKGKITYKDQDISKVFIHAIRFGEAELVRTLLADYKITCTNKDITDAFLEAMKKDNIEVLQTLLADERLFFSSETISLAFFRAAGKGHTDMLKILLQYKNMDINKVNMRWDYSDYSLYSPFVIALEYGQIEIAHALFADPRIDINKTLLDAAQFGLLETVEKLLQHPDININQTTGLEEKTALIVAASKGQTEVVRILLQRDDINVNQTDKWGHTALYHAAEGGHLEIYKALQFHKNALFQKNDGDYTLFSKAVQSGNLEMVKFLLESPDIDFNKGCIFRSRTPLYYLTSKCIHSKGDALTRNFQVFKILTADIRIDINAGDPFVTPLHLTVKANKFKMTQALLKREDLEVNKVNHKGRTALLLAVNTKNFKLAEILLKHPDIDINKADNEGTTVLMSAVRKNCFSLVQFLFNRSDLLANQKDKQGRNAFYHAVRKRNSKMVAFLLTLSGMEINEADREGTPFLYAIKHRHYSIFKILLADPRIDINKPNNEGETPLSAAIANKDEYCKELIEARLKAEENRHASASSVSMRL